MNVTHSSPQGRRLRARARAFAVYAPAALFLLASIALAQQTADAPREEVVADLAAGRVVIAVVKDSILVATVENPIEAQTRPPIPVQLSSERLAVVLGAIDWFSPSSRQDFARIDQELPRLRGRVLGGGPHISQTEGGSEASDIEVIGQGLLTRLNTVAGYLHSKIEQPAEDPLTELVIADYLTGYGPEVWQVTYNIDQEQQQGDYWDTRVMRPQYLQFWPPEKGQPRTLVEFAYPPENPPTPLLDLLRARDPRLEKVLASDSKMAEVATRFIEGDSKKIRSEDALQFLRAALAAIAPPDARQTFATIGEESGFAWVLQPPQEPAHGRQVASSPQQTGAPSLLKHPN